MRRLYAFAILFLLAGFSSAEVRSFVIAKDGKPFWPIVLSQDASARTRAAAKEFGKVLSEIVGAPFEVKSGDGAQGIVLGLAAEFPDLVKDERLTSKAITARENYLLRSEPERLLLLGNSEAAVEHAVWDLLYRLGYRQFFPGKNWEVIPQMRDLSVAVDALESPCFNARVIWYGFGPLPENRADYEDWCRKNRATAGIDLRTGHSYEGILARHKKEFAEHPEYLALVNGQRQGPKFCTANEDLRRLVVEDALARMDAEPSLDAVSCDPSDGGGWCQCPECAKLGSVSDRALLLANDVARAVQAQYLGKLVGMYAYNEHSPVPSISAEPNVVISVATGFIHGGFTVDQLIDGWSRRAKTIGIREYYSVHPWDRDLPGAARAANLDYLCETIPHFYEKRARFMSAESSDNWGCNGLGYYVAARLLWDVKEAAHKEELVNDFLEKCFGEAKGPMRKFYQLLDGAKKTALSDDLVGRMYRLLDEARQATHDVQARARLGDLVLYTRYVDLWLNYSSADGAARQRAFEQVLRHGWRMRRAMMIHTLSLWRDVPSRDKAVKVPEKCGYKIPEGKNPWKSSAPFTQAELDGFVSQGIATHALLDFEPVSFSGNLVPVTSLALPEVPEGSIGPYSRNVRNYFTWIAQAPATVPLKIKTGIIYTNSGPAKIEFYPAAEAEMKSVAHAEIAPDRQEHAVNLETSFSGLHRIEVTDHQSGTSTEFSATAPLTIVSSQEQPAVFYGRWTLYFYVPKGTKIVGGFASGASGGSLVNASGHAVHQFTGKPGYFSVPVEKGGDGRLWKFQDSAGQRTLMTVPPCLARSAKELLLPAEVVAKDAP